ncbi:MAG: hypothetical protein QF535_15745, partial [Anaerolineales bacterium]|nr:hypothetical protein [Anaerolineales bacterium]
IAHVALRRFQQRTSADAGRTKVLQDEYADKVREAIMFDSENLQARPAFYALVIHSNWSRRIF